MCEGYALKLMRSHPLEGIEVAGSYPWSPWKDAPFSCSSISSPSVPFALTSSLLPLDCFEFVAATWASLSVKHASQLLNCEIPTSSSDWDNVYDVFVFEVRSRRSWYSSLRALGIIDCGLKPWCHSHPPFGMHMHTRVPSHWCEDGCCSRLLWFRNGERGWVFSPPISVIFRSTICFPTMMITHLRDP